jgi:hypothetical protein
MDPFNENSGQGEGAPGMLMSGNGVFDPRGYRYRVERFCIGGNAEDDETSAMETLLTRSIPGDNSIVVLERKDSISATTGIYTCIVIYLEPTQTT